MQVIKANVRAVVVDLPADMGKAGPGQLEADTAEHYRDAGSVGLDR